jgi:pilus assembly protein CpaF
MAKPSRALGRMSLGQATEQIREIIQDPSLTDKANTNKEIVENTLAGVPGYKGRLQESIIDILESFGIEVEGMTHKEAAYEIYKSSWGLGPIEELYDDPSINEIRVNGPDQVVVMRNIQNERVDVKFKNQDEISNLVNRMIMHDRGVGINRSNPAIESMRKDGTRLTATCPPETANFTLALRKHFPNILAAEDHIKRGSMDDNVWKIIQTLIRGRANILVAGGVGSGKTTLVRTLFKYTNPTARTIVIESDSELHLARQFPDRDIVEFEEHPEVGRTLEKIFRTVLRYSPNMIILGEFRGAGEAKEAVRACSRGHDGSMATAHFPTPQEAIEGTGRLLVEEGMNISVEAATLLVANAYNVVIQMFGDSTRGVILIESVTEIIPKGSTIEYSDLIRWVPHGSDYLDGEWQIKNPFSPRLQNKLARYGVVE